jgi:hypothetical protein
VRIWKLSPRDRNAPIWQKGYDLEIIYVREQTGDDARNLAVKERVYPATQPSRYDQPPAVNPWYDPTATTCDDVTETGETNYSVDGLPAVLGQQSLRSPN